MGVHQVNIHEQERDAAQAWEKDFAMRKDSWKQLKPLRAAISQLSS